MRLAVPALVPQALAALLLAAGLSFGLHALGPSAMLTALFVLLAFVCFVALGVLRAMLISRRMRGRFSGPGGNGGGGPFASGVREPRRPRPPYMPPRGAAVQEPDGD